MSAIWQQTGAALPGGVLLAGAAAVVGGPGTVTIGNGWYKAWITFTLGAAAATEYIGIYNGTLNNYTGDGTSNVLVWAPKCAQLAP